MNGDGSLYSCDKLYSWDGSLGRCDFTTHDHAEVASMFVTYHCAYFSWGGGDYTN